MKYIYVRLTFVFANLNLYLCSLIKWHKYIFSQAKKPRNDEKENDMYKTKNNYF